MNFTLFSSIGMSRVVLSLSLTAACGISTAGEPLNLFQRLGEAISRASNRPPPPSADKRAFSPAPNRGAEYRTFDNPSTASGRYQPSYQDARQIQRTNPTGPQRYGEAGRNDRAAPTRVDGAGARSSIRFQPRIVLSTTQCLVEEEVILAPAPPIVVMSGGSLETIRSPLPRDPPALVPVPDLTPSTTLQPTVTVPVTPVPRPVTVPVTPVPRPVIPFANSVSYGRVRMSFPPYTVLDVQGLPRGSLAKDPTSGQIFRVP